MHVQAHTHTHTYTHTHIHTTHIHTQTKNERTNERTTRTSTFFARCNHDPPQIVPWIAFPMSMIGHAEPHGVTFATTTQSRQSQHMPGPLSLDSQQPRQQQQQQRRQQQYMFQPVEQSRSTNLPVQSMAGMYPSQESNQVRVRACVCCVCVTVCFVISLPRITFIHRIYMVLANPTSNLNT